MSRRGGYRAGTAALGVLGLFGVLGALGVLAVGVAVAVVVTIGGAETGVGAQAGGVSVLDASVTGPAAAVTDQVSVAAQRQAVAHWTRQRMRGATATAVPRGRIRTSLPAVTRTPGRPAAGRASGLHGASRATGLSRAGRAQAAEVTAPKGIPTASPFSGSPTTGALFYTTGGKGHFCSASVVDSTAGDLALTAAHCVYCEGVRDQHRVRARVPRRQAAVRGVAGPGHHGRERLEALARPRPRLRLPHPRRGRREADPGQDRRPDHRVHPLVQREDRGHRAQRQRRRAHQVRDQELQVPHRADGVLLPRVLDRHQRRAVDHRLQRQERDRHRVRRDRRLRARRRLRVGLLQRLLRVRRAHPLRAGRARGDAAPDTVAFAV